MRVEGHWGICIDEYCACVGGCGLGFGVWGLGLGVQVWGLGFWGWGVGFGV